MLATEVMLSSLGMNPMPAFPSQLSMLEELFPRHIIEHMLAREPTTRGPTRERDLKGLANQHDKVMVLFCDIVGFTTMSKDVEASEVRRSTGEGAQDVARSSG